MSVGNPANSATPRPKPLTVPRMALRARFACSSVNDQVRVVEPEVVKATRIVLPHIWLRRVDLRAQEREHDFVLGCRASLDHAAFASCRALTVLRLAFVDHA